VVALQGKMLASLIPTTETDKAGLGKKEMFRNPQLRNRSWKWPYTKKDMQEQ